MVHASVRLMVMPHSVGSAMGRFLSKSDAVLQAARSQIAVPGPALVSEAA